MPVYDYKCQQHGIFNDLATMNESNQPKACPTCGELCARVIMFSPQILDMVAEKRKAHEKNEKAQHEPIISTTDRQEHDKDHASACGCGNQMGKAKLMYTANGDKMFPSARPWMISH